MYWGFRYNYKNNRSKKGDEVIIPSFNFVSAVDTFASTGAKIVFCDIDNNFVLNISEIQKKNK